MCTSELRTTRTLAASILLLLVLAGGCAPLDLSKGISFPEWKTKAQPPERIADFWTEYMHREDGRHTVRGFGGRVMFYGTKAGEPVVVDGTLTVFAFDDSKGELNEQTPDKKFVFTRDQLAKHYSKSELGHSYSFWLPWDEVGGTEKKVTLITRFDDVTGKVVMSKPAKQTLFGTKPKDAKPVTPSPSDAQASKPASDAKVRQVSYEEPVKTPGPTAAPQDTPTTTIELTPSFARRLREAADRASQSQPIENAAPLTPASTTAPATSGASSPAAADPTATPTTPESAVATAATQSSLAARFEPGRFPVRRERTARPAFDHARMQPYPAAWPSALPRSPRTDQPTESTVLPQGVPEGSN